MFFSEFCKIFKSVFLYRTPPLAASETLPLLAGIWFVLIFDAENFMYVSFREKFRVILIGIYYKNFKNEWDVSLVATHTKMKFFVQDLFITYDQIRRKFQVWSHLLKKPLMKNFISCAVPCIPWIEKADAKMTLVLNFFKLSKVWFIVIFACKGN